MRSPKDRPGIRSVRFDDDSGLEMIEIALITALMLISLLAAIALIDDALLNIFDAISSALDSSGCC